MLTYAGPALSSGSDEEEEEEGMHIQMTGPQFLALLVQKYEY
jgi:hypothetical protein